MEELKNNKLIWVVGALVIFNLLILILGKVMVDKAADRVIQRLLKDYSPSPYGPGFDPDRLDPNSFNRKQVRVERENLPEQVSLPTVVPKVESWRENWEKARGTTLE